MNVTPDIADRAAANPLERALEGLRVIDFSQIAAGPLCTMLLADMGAEVIKIEPPEGDLGRRLGPPFLGGEESTLFLGLNRNKKSLVLDLKTEGGRSRAHRLVDGADVLVENFRPGVAERLGIGFQAMRQRNPKLLYCSISAYGQSGPWSAKPGVDGVLQAASGLMSITGAPGEPSKLLTPVADMVTGFHATLAILAALLQLREHGTAPDKLDLSLFASAFMMQQIPLSGYLMTGELPVRMGSAAPYATPNEIYETADGYIMIAAYQEERWRRFCRAIDRSDMAGDPRFVSLPQRMSHRKQLTEEINRTLQARDTLSWAERLERADVICAPVADYRMLMDSPQIAAAGLVAATDHPKAGRIAMPGFAIGGRAPPIRLAPPLLGEHNHIQDWESQ